MPLITVFTPTYNRRNLIEKLYQSLLQQTEKNFEWLVVDDGSTDNTDHYFSKLLQQEHPFPIRYFKQPNGGKHRAINAGVKEANGELFFIVDSDDYLTPNAIEKINQWNSTLDNTHKWAGLSGLKGYSSQQVTGQRNNSAVFVDAKNTERREYHLEGDKAEVYFTQVLKEHPFPEIPGENFISEEIVWNAIARDGYYLRWFNEIIYICDYLEDGLTKNDTKDKLNPIGRLLWAKGQLETFPHDLRKRLLAIAIYRRSVSNNESITSSAKKLHIHFLSVIFAQLAFNIYKYFLRIFHI